MTAPTPFLSVRGLLAFDAIINFFLAACNADARDENSVRPSVTRVYCDKMEERSVQIFTPYER